MIVSNTLKWKVYLLSILHFFVDGICAYTIFNRLYVTENYTVIILVFVIYNTLAFMTQPFLGMMIDALGKEKSWLNASLVLLLLGAVIPLYTWISLFLIGIANSMFHVVGGKYTVYVSQDKSAYLGLFVALGASGLAVGSYIYTPFLFPLLVSLTAILGLLCLFLKDEYKDYPQLHTMPQWSKVEKRDVLILGLAVTIRAIIGKAAPPLFEPTTFLLVGIGIASTLGKIIGGILADKMGIGLTVWMTLPLALIGYLFFRENAVMYLVSTLLFNTTMPITLFLANQNMKQREGLSFGILAFTLFPGYLLGDLYHYLKLPFAPLLVVCIGLTIAIIIMIDRKMRKRKIC